MSTPSAPITRHLSQLRSWIADRLVALCETEPHLHTQRIFSAAIYAWILLGTLMLLPYYDELWGPHSLANRVVFDATRWDHWLVHLSLHPRLADHTWVFFVGQLIGLALVLSKTMPRLGAITVYLFTFNIYQRTGQLLDGGNNLVQLLMFYFVFMNISGRRSEIENPTLRQASNAISNVAFWMCRFQLVIVYLTAGTLKLNGALWQKGMALYYILQGESYTHPLAREMVVAFPGVAMLATYATLAFQILFVVLIWHRPARKYLIAAGVGLHLCGIAFGMGLLFFGLVMCLAYLVFLPPDVSERLRRPLLDEARVRLSVPASRPRLAGLARTIAWLDLRRRTEVVVDGTELSASVGDETSVTGLAAVWLAAKRVPVLLPLLPLAWLAWYVGLAQRLYR